MAYGLSMMDAGFKAMDGSLNRSLMGVLDVQVRRLGLLIASLVMVGVMGFGCAHSSPTTTMAVKPLNSKEYGPIERSGSPGDAYLNWKAQQEGKSPSDERQADAALSTASNPFSHDDRPAVLMGRTMYVAHCAACHGPDADGQGQVAGLNTDKMSFHNIHKRMYIAMLGHAPNNWFPTIAHGTSAMSTTQPTAVKMPAFESVLAREQIWLIVTYLEQETLHPGQIVSAQ